VDPISSWLIPLAINLLTGGGSSQPKEPKAPERMSYDEAMGQARDVMTPQYEESKENVMGDVNKNLISRGFYGQAPGDALRANTMGNMETDFQGQLANYATNLQNQQYAQDYQTYQTNLGQYNQRPNTSQMLGSLAGQFLGGPGGESLFNWAKDSWFNKPNYTGGAGGYSSRFSIR
jgi:hypothetical protein